MLEKPISGICRQAATLWPGRIGAMLRVDPFEAAEIGVKDLAIADDVPFRQHRKAAFREPRRLDLELLVCFEVVSKFSQEFVRHYSALIVLKAVLSGLVHLEIVESLDGGFPVIGNLPVERPEPIVLTLSKAFLCWKSAVYPI